jgi:hypothetical protein
MIGVGVMPSREALLKLADEYRADAAMLEEKARQFAKLAEEAREKERILREDAANTAIDMNDTDSTLRTMDVNTAGRSASVKRGAGRATRKHPAQKKLYEKGKTITDIAADLGEGRPRVSSWFAGGDANRPIPRRHAEKLHDKYGIPLSAWSRIAD